MIIDKFYKSNINRLGSCKYFTKFKINIHLEFVFLYSKKEQNYLDNLQ